MKFQGFLLLIALAPGAVAEPYLAVQMGHSCAMCHTDPTGGGQRTTFGNVFAQQQLAAQPVDLTSSKVWTGEVADFFSVGGNVRVGARQFDYDDQDDNLNFEVERVTLYLSASLTDQVAFYLDQQVAPGGSLNREAWAQFKWDSWYFKAGKLFLPFGWRLQDDTAFVREVTGVNLNAGDNGMEIGFTKGQLNLQLAATNGNGGASEIDDGKLFSSRIEWIRPKWRIGFSALDNSTDLGERSMYGLFAGLNTGQVSWLFEYDHIKDKGFSAADMEQSVSLIEANVQLQQGHNLKLTLEAQTFDNNTDDRYRGSMVYEYFPWAFAQLRLGLRMRESGNAASALNSEEAFIQTHVFF